MGKFFRAATILACMLHFTRAVEVPEAGKCLHSEEETEKQLTLSVHCHRNETGGLWANFTATRDADNATVPQNVFVDVSQSVKECNGRTRIKITGFISEHQTKIPIRDADALRFDPNCGSNVAVVNEGRTVRKINLEIPLDSVVFTTRPLKPDELFEVRLDKKNTKFSLSLGIGGTTHSRKDIPIANHINHLPHPTWAQYHGQLYRNGSLAIKEYGKSLDALVVGDRVGMMRSSAGNLHFFVNGVDQGPAASNVPARIYAVLELYHDAIMATIISS
ncbi:neuralized-like protein 4 [Ischnura elegans]|uniref:neuralized-like protein 4 n=1 Tax=Ischnura elegans TaxID=197161 RepID=UPI001ED87AAB|nr:neuralized-like protein 4 [Ischnura elegans]XP_046396420.1 neuralized-like protein 4 [Ischnura elegans]